MHRASFFLARLDSGMYQDYPDSRESAMKKQEIHLDVFVIRNVRQFLLLQIIYFFIYLVLLIY